MGGGEKCRGGFCVRLSREGDCTMVGPLYRDPRPAAQLLISSAAHQSLVHDPPSRSLSLFLSPSLSAPISQPQPCRTPRGLSRSGAKEKKGKTSAFIYALGFEQSSNLRSRWRLKRQIGEKIEELRLLKLLCEEENNYNYCITCTNCFTFELLKFSINNQKNVAEVKKGRKE